MGLIGPMEAIQIFSCRNKKKTAKFFLSKEGQCRKRNHVENHVKPRKTSILPLPLAHTGWNLRNTGANVAVYVQHKVQTVYPTLYTSSRRQTKHLKMKVQ